MKAIIPDHIHNQLIEAMFNFALCERICEMLMSNFSVPRLPTSIIIKTQVPDEGICVTGETCGFFTTPVLDTAMLDVRRLLSLFGLKIDDGRMVPRVPRDNRPTDFSLADAGLPPVEVDKLRDISLKLSGSEIEPILDEILTYANKQLAHFTKDPMDENSILNSLKIASKVMVHSVMIHVYDAGEISRPRVPLVEITL